MDFTDLAIGVAAGNLMTLSAVWGFNQFVKHDEKAPRLAYIALFLPVGLIALGAYVSIAPL